MAKKAPGRTFLMVVGIFLILGGVFSAITSAMNFVMIGQEELAPILEQALQQTGISKSTYQTSLVILVIQAVINMVTGIIGVINNNKIEKASLCYVCGIVLIVCALINSGYAAFTGTFNIFSVLLSLILPLLYFWGALKNRQAMQVGQGTVVK